jgi:tetratricopeptide (TPR) repeat protein
MSSKPGRNDPCPCDSGRKFKHCCGGSSSSSSSNRRVGLPSAVTTLVQQAETLLRAGRFEQAVYPLEQATQLLPDNAGLAGDLGLTLLRARRVAQAIEWLQRSVSLQPGAAASHFNLGLALEEASQFDAAIAAYSRAASIAPDGADAHKRLADLLVRRGRHDDAIAAYERAASVAKASPLGLLCRAKALLLRDRATEAEPILRHLVASDATGEISLMLGTVLSEIGCFDEAAASFERCVAKAPGQSAAHHGLVHARRMTAGDRPIVDRILSLLRVPNLPVETRMTLHFAAGKALDDLNDPAGAMAQLDAANHIRARLFPFDHASAVAWVDRTVERFTRAFFEAHSGLGDGSETPVLVLGMPRSGTTLVERIVASHPRVAGGGELRYWNHRAPTVIDAPTDELARTAEALRGDYLAVLRGVGRSAARVTDKMPYNFRWMGLVHLLLPRARFIHCRRHPIDTCLSNYSVQSTQGWAGDRAGLVAYYRQYQRLMDHWRAVIPRDRLLEIDYEEATASPEVVSRRLVDFCGLPWDPACLRPELNPDIIRTASRWQARQPVYRTSVERWRRYEPWLGELRTLVDDGPR